MFEIFNIYTNSRGRFSVPVYVSMKYLAMEFGGKGPVS